MFIIPRMTPDQGLKIIPDALISSEPVRTSRLVVEIGPGEFPLPFNPNSILKNGDRYLGIDDPSVS